MPPTYPNLDHPYFYFGTSSGQSSHSTITRLGQGVTSLITEDLSGYSFDLERSILKKAERSEQKEDFKAEAAAAEEERMKRELETSQNLESSNPTSSERDAVTSVRMSMLQRMKSLTLAEDEVCERYLKGKEWNLEEAVQEFYSQN